MKIKDRNKTVKEILINILIAFISLFINGLGVYLTIHANIGAGPWDVLNLGLSKTLNIVYGNASISVSLIVLLIDILLKEPIGIAMIIDAFTVGKAVDFFNYLNIIPTPKTLLGGVVMMIVGLFIVGYTQMTYMYASLGCGPRDTLLVGLKRHIKRVPIGVVSIGLLCLVTFSGWLLGGQVGVGTLICAFLAGPIMQSAFDLMRFDATEIKHQNIKDSFNILKKGV
ncbi:MAG: hypothetical protein Q4B60_08825 [Erysipelotrichaceae bacterium]|nr:hypothetical protein [Erysipelotrichaceae bacterium]